MMSFFYSGCLQYLNRIFFKNLFLTFICFVGLGVYSRSRVQIVQLGSKDLNPLATILASI